MSKIKKHVKQAQNRQKHYYDKTKRHIQFEEGDLVFLQVKLTHFKLILGKDRRLTPHFLGPFKIIKRVGKLAYHLEFPSNVKAHPIFHVSLLKKYVANPNHVLQDKSKLKDDATLDVKRELILDRRVWHLRNTHIVEILMKWDLYPIKDAT